VYALSRLKHWLGWERQRPSVAIEFSDEGVAMLAMRQSPARITAYGLAPLEEGVVSNGLLRLWGPAVASVRALREHLAIAPGAALAIVVPDGSVASTQAAALIRCGEDAGFGRPRLVSADGARSLLAHASHGPANNFEPVSVVRPVQLAYDWRTLLGAAISGGTESPVAVEPLGAHQRRRGARFQRANGAAQGASR
jgi:hypothetical protein